MSEFSLLTATLICLRSRSTNHSNGTDSPIPNTLVRFIMHHPLQPLRVRYSAIQIAQRN